MKRITMIFIMVFILNIGFSNIYAKILDGKKKSFRFSVKLIPYPSKKTAQREVEELEKAGYHPYLKKEFIDNTATCYVITVKDTETLEQADKFLQEFSVKTGEFAYITKYNTLTIVKTGPVQVKERPREAASKSHRPTLKAPSQTIYKPTTPVTTMVNPPLSGSVEQKIAQLEERLNRLQQEAEARKKLEVSEEEKKKKEEKILEAAGREYLLLPKGRLSLEYSLGYSYYSYDVLESVYSVEHHANHNIRNTITTEYAVLNNLTLTMSVPFVYKYDKVGTDKHKDVTDIGDVSFGVRFQPFKNTGKWPAPIISSSLILPTGRGIYDINVDDELSTGGSLLGLSSSISVSKPIDPVNAFASAGYTYYFEKHGIDQVRGGDILKKVKPGGTISGSVGIGYALSYNMSLSLSYSYSLSLSSKYFFKSGKISRTGTSVSSSVGISTGWYITPKRSIILGTSIGLTTNDPDFTFSLRIPFEYNLVK